MRPAQFEALHPRASLKSQHPANRGSPSYEYPPLPISLFCDRNWLKDEIAVAIFAAADRHERLNTLSVRG